MFCLCVCIFMYICLFILCKYLGVMYGSPSVCALCVFIVCAMYFMISIWVAYLYFVCCLCNLHITISIVYVYYVYCLCIFLYLCICQCVFWSYLCLIWFFFLFVFFFGAWCVGMPIYTSIIMCYVYCPYMFVFNFKVYYAYYLCLILWVLSIPMNNVFAVYYLWICQWLRIV